MFINSSKKAKVHHTSRWHIESPHSLSIEQTFHQLEMSEGGLSKEQVKQRIAECGLNSLPQAKLAGMVSIFIKQFESPLIYILVVAAIVSMLVREWSDAIFIGAILIINAIIGTIQEFSAQKAAAALKQLVTTRCRVIRDNESYEIDAQQLVPGDIILLGSGDSVAADLRIIHCYDLAINESLLTGESVAVQKNNIATFPQNSPLGDRLNMAFAGTLVSRGRATGIVVATALNTQLGRIANSVLNKPPAKAPLIERMEKFTHKIAILVAVAAIMMAIIAFSRGTEITEIFMLTVALAVSAIPEGLPVAITVALAISMRRMAKRNVIVRQLVAVEALGSCTYVATDKTGTLTVNQLMVKRVVIPTEQPWTVTGESLEPQGEIKTASGQLTDKDKRLLHELCRVCVLSNEAFLGKRDQQWVHHGDAVDVALLVLAHKNDVRKVDVLTSCPELNTIPFESKNQFAASLNLVDKCPRAFVKGALEKILSMCSHMATSDGLKIIDEEILEAQAVKLASQGYRVIALASGDYLQDPDEFCKEQLDNLTLVGLIGMIDPLRKEAKNAIFACQRAGVKIAMVTGDHPVTALAIAKQLKLAESDKLIVTGPQLKKATTEQVFDNLIEDARVFSRIEPEQKLSIVESLQRNGHFVAVSGDGANDAPALRAAHVGVAMGSGTDVAKETAELVITDDNLSSIVAGIEEGRIAYSNVRKVIFLLISTGVAELVLFVLSLLTGLPIPLVAVQLLWLNLVTNGIQDVALAFEPGEGHELCNPPRKPSEVIFNRIMIERVVVSAIVMGVVAFLLFSSLLNSGMNVDTARNSTLLLMVLFENVHVFNCRSESLSVFTHSLLKNPILVFGTLAAQLIHIGSMYTPWIKDVLAIQPVSLTHWGELLAMALSLMLVMELHKWFRRKFPVRT